MDTRKATLYQRRETHHVVYDRENMCTLAIWHVEIGFGYIADYCQKTCGRRMNTGTWTQDAREHWAFEYGKSMHDRTGVAMHFEGIDGELYHYSFALKCDRTGVVSVVETQAV